MNLIFIQDIDCPIGDYVGFHFIDSLGVDYYIFASDFFGKDESNYYDTLVTGHEYKLCLRELKIGTEFKNWVKQSYASYECYWNDKYLVKNDTLIVESYLTDDLYFPNLIIRRFDGH